MSPYKWTLWFLKKSLLQRWLEACYSLRYEGTSKKLWKMEFNDGYFSCKKCWIQFCVIHELLEQPLQLCTRVDDLDCCGPRGQQGSVWDCRVACVSLSQELYSLWVAPPEGFQQKALLVSRARSLKLLPLCARSLFYDGPQELYVYSLSSVTKALEIHCNFVQKVSKNWKPDFIIMPVLETSV